VLICLKGSGYTYTWPEHLGMQPWAVGNGDRVKRQDYEFGGMVSAAPMTGDWFHQHFGASAEPLRLTAWFGPNNSRSRKPGVPGEALTDRGAIDIKKGGDAIPYNEEDPYLRKEFEAKMASLGRESRMNPKLYTGEAQAEDDPGNAF
jgi:hypothetical protein